MITSLEAGRREAGFHDWPPGFPDKPSRNHTRPSAFRARVYLAPEVGETFRVAGRTAPSLERATGFMWRNARLLERALFALLFERGPAQAVVSALRAYRNPDGGFGHALEPDVRAPDSMPVHTEFALRALNSASVLDPDIAFGACEFLAAVAEPDGRVPIVLPAVLEYPHASHWAEPIFTGDSINPTGALVGLLHEQAVQHPWLKKATECCWRRVEQPIADAHDIVSALTFLEYAPDRGRAEKTAERIVGAAGGASFYHAEPGATSYGLTPLHLCPMPDAIGRKALAEELVEAHLDQLAAQQQDDGGWPISFEPPSPASAFEWRGRWTLDALSTLRAYDRI